MKHQFWILAGTVSVFLLSLLHSGYFSIQGWLDYMREYPGSTIVVYGLCYLLEKGYYKYIKKEVTEEVTNE